MSTAWLTSTRGPVVRRAVHPAPRRCSRSPACRTGGVPRPPAGTSPPMADPLDVQLEDPELLEETILAAELIVAATHSPDDVLPQAAIDGLLGLSTSASSRGVPFGRHQAGAPQ